MEPESSGTSSQSQSTSEETRKSPENPQKTGGLNNNLMLKLSTGDKNIFKVERNQEAVKMEEEEKLDDTTKEAVDLILQIVKVLRSYYYLMYTYYFLKIE